MRLLSDRIQEFIDWLEGYTDYGKDHMDVIHKKLIECMISDPPEEARTEGESACPSCSGTGRVEDPQHGHDMRCERCGGKGYVQTR